MRLVLGIFIGMMPIFSQASPDIYFPLKAAEHCAELQAKLSLPNSFYYLRSDARPRRLQPRSWFEREQEAARERLVEVQSRDFAYEVTLNWLGQDHYQAFLDQCSRADGREQAFQEVLPEALSGTREYRQVVASLPRRSRSFQAVKESIEREFYKDYVRAGIESGDVRGLKVTSTYLVDVDVRRTTFSNNGLHALGDLLASGGRTIVVSGQDYESISAGQLLDGQINMGLREILHGIDLQLVSVRVKGKRVERQAELTMGSGRVDRVPEAFIDVVQGEMTEAGLPVRAEEAAPGK